MSDNVKISPLELSPESELYQQSLELWLKMMALSFGVSVDDIILSEKGVQVDLIHKRKDDNPPT